MAISARMPASLLLLQAARPKWARMRFSPTSGTTSAIVPSAASAVASIEEVSERLADAASPPLIAMPDSPRELERHARAAEVRVGIGGAVRREARVDDGEAVGERCGMRMRE